MHSPEFLTESKPSPLQRVNNVLKSFRDSWSGNPEELATIRDPARFYSVVVESSGAAPIEMTGERDIERQDWELQNIFGIETAS